MPAMLVRCRSRIGTIRLRRSLETAGGNKPEGRFAKPADPGRVTRDELALYPARRRREARTRFRPQRAALLRRREPFPEEAAGCHPAIARAAPAFPPPTRSRLSHRAATWL